MTDREKYLSDPLHITEHSNHDAVIPPWMVREAEQLDPLEAEFKAKVEIDTKGRFFREKYLDRTKMDKKNNQTADWKPEEAAKWLSRECSTNDKFDRERAMQILEASGAVDEKRTEVMSLITAEDADTKLDKTSPTYSFDEVTVPPRVSNLDAEKQLNQAKELKKSKKVGSYGIILTESNCDVFQRGRKVASLDVEDWGGYPVVADELESMETEAQVQAMFEIVDEEREVAKIGWFTGVKKKADAPLVNSPDLERQDQPGEFSEHNIDQHDPARDFAADPGPISKTPNSRPEALSPGIPDLGATANVEGINLFDGDTPTPEL